MTTCKLGINVSDFVNCKAYLGKKPQTSEKSLSKLSLEKVLNLNFHGQEEKFPILEEFGCLAAFFMIPTYLICLPSQMTGPFHALWAITLKILSFDV